MTRKIFFLFAMLVAFAMHAMAAKAAAPDSVFVVKNGRIVSAYEVGKDVDNITFQKKTVLEGNCINVGGELVNIKSAILTQQNGYYYAYLSSLENATTTQEMMAGGKLLLVAFSPSLLDEKITFSKFEDDFADDFFQIQYMDVDKADADDDYEPISVSAYDWEGFTDGTIYVNLTDDDELELHFDCEPQGENAMAFAGQYTGEYTEIAQNPYYFQVDDDRKELRAVFAEKVADGMAFYLTPGNIEKASELESCYYYARLFVPNSLMDGNDINVQGDKEYELTFVDNVTDMNNPQVVQIANGMAGNATGYVSVLDRGDGSYTVIVDVEGLGKGGDRDLQIVYRGTPSPYDLSEPSEYSVAGGEPIALKSAVAVVDTSNEDQYVYTIYLSSKADITTVEGMADADIVLTLPEDFLNDDLTHGFSGTALNAMLSVAYGGNTYSQANCGSAVGAIAQGGNMKAEINAGKAVVDFMVFGSTKFGGSLKGHYEGSITKLTK